MEIDNNFCKAYIQLRTVLDALEMNALNFVLEDKATRYDRAVHIEKLVKSCYDEMAKYREDEMEKLRSQKDVQSYQEKDGINMPCPQGYQYCDGVCVPYNCPLSSE